ncbi:HTH-type transcriptional regulator iscR [Cedecea lapagei]|uniref:HTH-type transcriptional regulator iscR n=1 Tax=Cedecea lapagei TaxID=158823 RepID=A0A447V432_9ENTR|nr:Rrf2 family transcriptional regulator [Cedecea lapagei]VEB99005.1 HTH-type transcriptional regulator iscR [Cedecea lapagei]
MEFGMKRVMASVHAMAALQRILNGSFVALTTLSKEANLSTSYLEQIFNKLRAGKLVVSQRGPGGGYAPRAGDISVSEVIRAVSKIPNSDTFKPVLTALDGVLLSELAKSQSAAP